MTSLCSTATVSTTSSSLHEVYDSRVQENTVSDLEVVLDTISVLNLVVRIDLVIRSRPT